VRRMPGFQARNVLITGSNPYSLRLARAFHETGHHVTIAATQTGLLPPYVALSFARLKYIHLRADPHANNPPLWMQEILSIISKEHTELWIDCSTDTPASLLAQAKVLAEKKTSCLCFTTGPNHATVFSKSTTFLKFAAEHSLPVPESHDVKSRDDIHKILHKSKGKRKYVLSETNGTTTPRPGMLLPRRTLSQTYDEVARIKILQNSKLRLEQAVEDGGQYRSTSIIVNGKLKAFAACTFMPNSPCPSYAALPSTSPLFLAMTHFVNSLTSKIPDYTGHLTIDFTVEERPSASDIKNPSIEKRVLPISASTSPSAPLLLFNSLSGSIALARAYISIFGRNANGFTQGDEEISVPNIAPPAEDTTKPSSSTSIERGVYALVPSVYHLLLLPVLRLLGRHIGLREGIFYILGAAVAFVRQIVWWQEATYDWRDPLPFWWACMVEVPVRLAAVAWTGESEAAGKGAGLSI
jgi:hypothetical protein